MNTQNTNDANKSTPNFDKKRDAAPAMPGKSDKQESQEHGKSHDAGQNEGKVPFSKGDYSTGKGEHSTGVR